MTAAGPARRQRSAAIRLGLALAWLALLLLAGWWLAPRLQLSGDLRKFMPDAQTPAQKLLIDELGEGPGSSLLLLAVSGDDAATLAGQSQALRDALAGDERFVLVANGAAAGLDAIPGRLRPYRYLLSPTLDSQAFDADYLGAQLDARVQDLGSPAAAMIEPLVPADPTLETLVLAQSWQPANGPQRKHGVWFDAAGKQALLAVQTRAAGFDPTGQQLAVAAIEQAFAEARGDSTSQLTLTGPAPSRSRSAAAPSARPAGSAASTHWCSCCCWRWPTAAGRRRCWGRCRWPAAGWPDWPRSRWASTGCTGSPSHSASP